MFFNEIDFIQNGTLITFLGQLRDGYVSRPEIHFVHIVHLQVCTTSGIINQNKNISNKYLELQAPFNIITKALTNKSFKIPDIETLFEQYTLATGQVFTKWLLIKYTNKPMGNLGWLTPLPAKLLKTFHKMIIKGTLPNKWIDNVGNIDVTGLLKGFQQFWRQNSDILILKYAYKEAESHFILKAFLQRIINVAGII